MNGESLNAVGTLLIGIATLVTAIGGFIAIRKKSATNSYEEIERQLEQVKADFKNHKRSVQEEFDKILAKHRDELLEKEVEHRRELDERDAHHDNEIRDIKIGLRNYEGALISAVAHIQRLETPYRERGESPPIRPLELQSFIAGL